MNTKHHWEQVYQTKAADQVSWFSPHLQRSMSLIRDAATQPSMSIIDVGGGESTLVDDLLQAGYQDVSVLDISQAAIDVTRARLGAAGQRVTWLAADITQATLPAARYDVWHDRAVFHFLTETAQREAYVRQVLRSVKPGGHVIVATFGPEGPLQCSGLNVVRYNADGLHSTFGDAFALVLSNTELHRTPFGNTQQFVYCYCVRA